MRQQKIRELPARTFWNVVVVTLLTILGVFWVSFHFVRPIPPRTLTMTTGMEGGSFYRKLNGLQSAPLSSWSTCLVRSRKLTTAYVSGVAAAEL